MVSVENQVDTREHAAKFVWGIQWQANRSLGVGGLQLRKRAQDSEDKTNVGFFLSTEDIDLSI